MKPLTDKQFQRLMEWNQYNRAYSNALYAWDGWLCDKEDILAAKRLLKDKLSKYFICKNSADLIKIHKIIDEVFDIK